MLRWLGVSMATLGFLLVGTALLIWWSASEALGPAPVVISSPKGGLSRCGYRPGQAGCDPPELSAATVSVIVALAVAGVLMVAVAAVVSVRRHRRPRKV